MIAKNNWRLVTAAGLNVNEGMILLDFRGEEHTLKGGEPPHKPSSTGRVWTDHGEFYPSVFRLEWKHGTTLEFSPLQQMVFRHYVGGEFLHMMDKPDALDMVGDGLFSFAVMEAGVASSPEEFRAMLYRAINELHELVGAFEC